MTWGQWLHAGLGGVAVLLAGLSVAGAERNRAAATANDSQRAALARTQQFAQVDTALVQLLAKAAVERNDSALRALLAVNGVTFQVNAPAVAPAASQVQVAPAAGLPR